MSALRDNIVCSATCIMTHIYLAIYVANVSSYACRLMKLAFHVLYCTVRHFLIFKIFQITIYVIIVIVNNYDEKISKSQPPA